MGVCVSECVLVVVDAFQFCHMHIIISKRKHQQFNERCTWIRLAEPTLQRTKKFFLGRNYFRKSKKNIDVIPFSFRATSVNKTNSSSILLNVCNSSVFTYRVSHYIIADYWLLLSMNIFSECQWNVKTHQNETINHKFSFLNAISVLSSVQRHHKISPLK